MKALILLCLLSNPRQVTVTWYDGPGPGTACGDPFSTSLPTAAAPLTGPLNLPCYTKVWLCTDHHCTQVTITDRIPDASSRLYNHQVLDLTPAAMQNLGIPFGTTPAGQPYGRAQVTIWPSPVCPALPEPCF